MLSAGAARAGVIAADLRHGADERGPTRCSVGVAVPVRMAMVMMAMVMPVIVRMAMPAAAGVIDGGFQGFARQGRDGLGLGIGWHDRSC